jgi:hypothetical protein
VRGFTRLSRWILRSEADGKDDPSPAAHRRRDASATPAILRVRHDSRHVN